LIESLLLDNGRLGILYIRQGFTGSEYQIPLKQELTALKDGQFCEIHHIPVIAELCL